MKCTHPSWEPANDGSGRERCGVCGARGSERRFLEVEGESRMPLIPSELLLIVHDPLMGPALLELLRRVKERLDGVAVRDPRCEPVCMVADVGGYPACGTAETPCRALGVKVLHPMLDGYVASGRGTSDFGEPMLTLKYETTEQMLAAEAWLSAAAAGVPVPAHEANHPAGTGAIPLPDDSGGEQP